MTNAQEFASPVISDTRRWVERVVVGLSLCPFARKELEADRVRFVETDADSEEALLQALHAELQHLEDSPETETTLLILPAALRDFDDYLNFLAMAEDLLDYLGLEGVYQIASFHPRYRFEGTGPEDTENYTNRSPWPMLHLLREDSLAQAIDRHPDVEGIPGRNIELMNRMSVARLRELMMPGNNENQG
ncbi:MAG: DUF1415 domain-containing protein [Pseudomonadota bacterium]|nr:DUF1415 domain-containing protein [Pseudomonadota bacterium]